jgi:hypothetical protein
MENPMTKVMSGAAMLAAIILTSMPAVAAGPICLASRDIKDTDAQKDGTAILYTMRDGSVWRNDLRGRCPTIRWNGFGYSTANPQSSICENEQTLVDFRTGETCGLGKFTQVAPPRMERHAAR